MSYKSCKRYNLLNTHEKSVIDCVAQKLEKMAFSDNTSPADIPEMEKLANTWCSYGMDKPDKVIYEIQKRIEENERNKLAALINQPPQEQSPRQDPPLNIILEDLTTGNDPVLRSWTEGRYKCNSLRRFIEEYIKKADNLTPALIRDYLLSEKSGNPFADNTITAELNRHGPGRKI